MKLVTIIYTGEKPIERFNLVQGSILKQYKTSLKSEGDIAIEIRETVSRSYLELETMVRIRDIK